MNKLNMRDDTHTMLTHCCRVAPRSCELLVFRHGPAQNTQTAKTNTFFFYPISHLLVTTPPPSTLKPLESSKQRKTRIEIPLDRSSMDLSSA